MADRKEDYVASSFDQAFARARRSGSKTFKWANPKTGKMGEYSTKMAGEDASTPKSADSSKPVRSAMYSSPADTAKFRADRDKPRTDGGAPKTPSRGIAAFKKAYGTAKEEQAKAEKGLKEASDTTSRTTREMLADVPKMAAEAGLAAATPAAGRAVLPRMGGMSPSAIERALARVPGRTVPNITTKDLMRGQSTPEIGQGLVDRLTEAARYSPETAAGLKKGGSVRPGKVKTVMHEFKAGKLKSSSGQKVTNPKQAVAIAMSEAGMKKPKKFAGKSGSYVGGMSDKEAKAYADTELANQATARKMMKERAEELRQRKSEVERKAGKNMQSIRQSQEDSSFTTTPYKKGGDVKESKAMAKKEISFMQRKGAPKSMIKHEKEEYGMKSGGKVKKFAAGGRIKGYADGGTLGPLAGRGGAPRAAVTAAQQGMRPSMNISGQQRTPQGNAYWNSLTADQRNRYIANQSDSGMSPNALSRAKPLGVLVDNSPQIKGNVPNLGYTAYNQVALDRQNAARAYANAQAQEAMGRELSPVVYNEAALQYGVGAGKPAQPVLWQQAPYGTGAGKPVQSVLWQQAPLATGYKKGGAIAMKKGGACMKKGGSIDGIAQRGKTKTQHFAKGGSVSARADGIATKGKTNCKMR